MFIDVVVFVFTFGSCMFTSIYVCLRAPSIHDEAFHSLLPSDVQHNDTQRGVLGIADPFITFRFARSKFSPLAKNKPAEISERVGLGATESSLAPRGAEAWTRALG